MNILGVLFSSTLFDNRAPEGHSLLTIFIGGARQPELASLTESQRLELVKADLQILFDINAEPVLVHQTVWEKSIPQYHVGYGHYKSIINDIYGNNFENIYFDNLPSRNSFYKIENYILSNKIINVLEPIKLNKNSFYFKPEWWSKNVDSKRETLSNNGSIKNDGHWAGEFMEIIAKEIDIELKKLDLI